MAMAIMENGRKRSKRRKRRNPTATTIRGKSTGAKIMRRRSNGTTKAGAMSFAKKNGLKLVSRSANPKRKRSRRRNGVTVSRARNGFFGNTKGDVKQVVSLGAGALGTKALGRIVAGFAQPYLSQIGLGNYAEILSDLAIAVFGAPMVASKLAGSEAGKMARLGGLLTVLLDAIELVAPNVLQNSLFNSSPLVLSAGGVGIKPEAVAQLVQGVANSANPQAEAAKIAGAMYNTEQQLGLVDGEQASNMPQPIWN